jgi:hypothetical protein
MVSAMLGDVKRAEAKRSSHALHGSRLLGAIALSLAFAGLASGCYDDPEPSGYCGTVTSRYRECGLLDAGRFECVDYGDSVESCETDCYASASCDSVYASVCGGDGGLTDCLSECFGTTTFECDDGKRLLGVVRCSGSAECEDGTDELECDEVGYPCRNAEQRIGVELFCDGTEDCDDGSDEPPDCGTALTCDGDFDVPGYLVCDGIRDCADGADEPADCAVLVCPG